ARDPRPADPGHVVRDPEAAEVPPADLPGRPVALPPPLLEHRLLAAAHRAHALCLVHRALGLRPRHPVRAVAPARLELGVGRDPGRAGRHRPGLVGVRRLHPGDPEAAPPARASGRPEGTGRSDTKSARRLTSPSENPARIGYSSGVLEELVLSRSRTSGILTRSFFTVRSDDRISTAGRSAPSGAMAGFTLLAVLLLCVGIGLGIGWAAGSAAVGAAVGAVIGIPASFYIVYRTYRDL